jgi:hypothetical protein
VTRRAGLRRSTLLPAHLMGTMPSSARGKAPAAGYRLGDPGRPAPIPTLVIALFDNSGSVTGPSGNDPLSGRFAEARKAFTAVGRRGSRRELGAVIHFDTPSRGDVSPTPLTWYGLPDLVLGLRVPPDSVGSSELAPSLQRAVELAESRPTHRATLVVFSDFLLLDPNPNHVLARLAAFPGDVHAVVLGSRPPAGLQNERITVTCVMRDDPPGSVARALFSSLITHRPGSQLDGANRTT